MMVLDPIDFTREGVVVSSNVPEDDALPAPVATKVYAAGDRVMDPASHLFYESKVGQRSVVAITVGSSGVIAWPKHGLAAGTPISFESTGTLPAPLAVNAAFYVVAPSTDALSVSTSPGGVPVVFSGTQSGVHSAVAGQNLNRPLSNTTYWLQDGATNRRRMLDDFNNTQTEYPDVIVLEIKPKSIAQGVYLGNLDATRIVITSTDPTRGVVHQEERNLQTSSSASSMYRWLFGRRRRTRFFLTLALPLYYNTTLRIEIHNPGAIAKCGMCRVGAVEKFGLTQYGLSSSLKDYSSTIFNNDGTSKTTERGFAKRMSLDVILDSEEIDYMQDWLAARRQRSLVYIGIKDYDWTVICGKYSSFNNVIPDVNLSKMSLQIEGTV